MNHEVKPYLFFAEFIDMTNLSNHEAKAYIYEWSTGWPPACSYVQS